MMGDDDCAAVLGAHLDTSVIGDDTFTPVTVHLVVHADLSLETAGDTHTHTHTHTHTPEQ